MDPDFSVDTEISSLQQRLSVETLDNRHGRSWTITFIYLLMIVEACGLVGLATIDDNGPLKKLVSEMAPVLGAVLGVTVGYYFGRSAPSAGAVGGDAGSSRPGSA